MKLKSMKKELKMLEDIDEMRDYMHNLINIKGTLIDKDIISASQKLDSKLNAYNKYSEHLMNLHLW